MAAHDQPARPLESPTTLQGRAYDNLRFIRDAMASTGRLSALPGRGTAVMGLTAGVAALVAAQLPVAGDAWLGVWLVEALVAFAIGIVSMRRKAGAAGVSLSTGVGRRFVFGLLPAMVAGAVLTPVLHAAGAGTLLPGTWLLLYGVAVMSGGAFSVRVVQAMGMCFMALGAACLIIDPVWLDLAMALGFGGLHVGFGLVVARRYGG